VETFSTGDFFCDIHMTKIVKTSRFMAWSQSFASSKFLWKN